MKRQNIARTTLFAVAILALGGSAFAQTTVLVQSVGVTGTTPSASDNDFTRLRNAIQNVAAANTTIRLEGVFDLSEANAYSSWKANTVGIYGFPYSGIRLPLERYRPFGATVDTITGIKDITIESAPSGRAEIRGASIAQARAEQSAALGMFFAPDDTDATFGNSRVENLTIRNIDFTGCVQYFLFTSNYNNTTDPRPNGSRIWGLTFENNTVRLGAWQADAFSGTDRIPIINGTSGATSDAQGWKFRNNTFEVVSNSAPIPAAGTRPTFMRMYYSHTGASVRGEEWSGNTFLARPDLSLTPGYFWPTLQTVFLFDNANANATGYSVTNNVFDGLLDAGGTPFYHGFLAINLGSSDGTTPANANNKIFDNNTFRGFMTAIHSWNLSPSSAYSDFTFTNTTIENCGWQDGTWAHPGPVLPNWQSWRRPAGPSLAPWDSIPGPKVVANGYRRWAPDGPIKIRFDLNLSVNRKTGAEAYYEIASLPGFFEGTAPGGLPFGVLEAYIDPPFAGSPVNNSAWTSLPRFSDPTPGVNDGLILGYNAFGDPAPVGNVNEIASITPAGPVTIEIAQGGSRNFAPGTIINRPVTIRTVGTRSGSPTVAGAAKPTNFSAGAPLFTVTSGGSLTLENVILDGDATASGSTRDVPAAVDIDDALVGTASVTINNSTLRNFYSYALALDRAGTYNITNSVIENSGGGIRTGNGSANVLTQITDSVFQSIGDTPYQHNGGSSRVYRNEFRSWGGALIFFVSSGGVTPNRRFEFGGPGNGNLIFKAPRISLNTGASWAKPADSFVYANNWTATRFENDADQNGFTGTDIVYVDTLGDDFIETNVVATFDRDSDGMPDAFELGSGTYNFLLADSDSNGRPDGVDYYGTAFSTLTADADSDGYPDWYEAASGTNPNSAASRPALGDVNPVGTSAGIVDLSDAVRALQIINGTQAPADNDANPNAINVMGRSTPLSLNNALQILRFQAGSRQRIPGVLNIQ